MGILSDTLGENLQTRPGSQEDSRAAARQVVGDEVEQDRRRRARLILMIESCDRDTLRDLFPALYRLLEDRGKHRH